MDTTKKSKILETESAAAERAFPQSISEHATELEQTFSTISKDIKKRQNYSIKWSKATRKFIKTGVESAVEISLSDGIIPQFPSKKGKKAFINLVLDRIGAELSDQTISSVPEADFIALQKSFQDLAQKIQTLPSVPNQCDQHPEDLAVSASANRNTDDSLSKQVARLSVDYKTLGTSDDERPDNNRNKNTRAAQPEIRLQGSVDLSADESEDESNQDSDDGVKVEIKEEKKDEAKAITLPDPAVFTISLGVPSATDDNSFAILFNDKRVLHGLTIMPAHEIWQLVRDAIYYDPDIPRRILAHPWITHVEKKSDGTLIYQTKTEEDLHTLTTNVQWARYLRDTISAGIKTYKVLLKQFRVRRAGYGDTASMINKIRERNSGKIPSLNHIGAIRDVTYLHDPASKGPRDYFGGYLLVFGSKEAANAALDMGLLYRNKKHACVVYSPKTQWHEQCSHCRSHSHTAQDCQSGPTCGKCSYKHLTQYCTSAKIQCANCHGEHLAWSRICTRWLDAEDQAHRSYRFPAEEGDSATQTVIRSPPWLPVPIKQKPRETLSKKPTQNPPKKPPKPTLTSSNPAKTALKHIPQPAAALKPTTHKNAPPTNTNPNTNTSTNTTTTNAPTNPPTSSSALLQTIDAFRAFVLARENENPYSQLYSNPTSQRLIHKSKDGRKETKRKRKREEEQRMMAGAGALLGDDELGGGGGGGGKRLRRGEEGEKGGVGEGGGWGEVGRGYVPRSLR